MRLAVTLSLLAGAAASAFAFASAFTFASPFAQPSPISMPPHAGLADVETTCVILPGFGVEPEAYRTFAYSLQTALLARNVSTDVRIARFSGNMMHNVQAEKVVDAIVAEARAAGRLPFIVGHSQGGWSGIEAAKRHGVPLVQWASTFNSRCVLPFPSSPIDEFRQPLLTLLCERDEHLPCLDVIKDLDDMSSCSVEPFQCVQTVDLGHFGGLHSTSSKNREARLLASRVAPFVSCILSGRHGDEVRSEARRCTERYEQYLRAADGHSVAKWSKEVVRTALGIDDDVADADVDVDHHWVPSSAILTFLAVAYRRLQPFVDAAFVLPRFVGAPDAAPTRSHTYSPVAKTPLPDCITEPSNYVQIRLSDDTGAVTARRLNELTIRRVRESMTPVQVRDYEASGKSIEVGDDVRVPHCLWMLAPTRFEVNDDGRRLTVRSPVATDGRWFRAQLLSERQVWEHVLKAAFHHQ
jgi:hypothetical protein